jgi:hypothetical protein
MKFGMAIAAKIAMIKTTINSSIKVKALLFLPLIIVLLPSKRK